MIREGGRDVIAQPSQTQPSFPSPRDFDGEAKVPRVSFLREKGRPMNDRVANDPHLRRRDLSGAYRCLAMGCMRVN